MGPASSRTVRSPRAKWPSVLPRVRVSSVVGIATIAAMVAMVMAAPIRASSVEPARV